MELLNVSLLQAMNTFLSMFRNFPATLLGGIGLELLYIMKGLMYTLIVAFVGILRVVGPLAICVSILFPSQLKKWFLGYTTAKLTILSMMIVENIMFGLLNYFKTSGLMGGKLGNAASYVGDITIQSGFVLTGILCYALSFWFTAQWFGSESAGKFLSTAAGIGMAALSGGVSKIGNILTSIGSSGSGSSGS